MADELGVIVKAAVLFWVLLNDAGLVLAAVLLMNIDKVLDHGK